MDVHERRRQARLQAQREYREQTAHMKGKARYWLSSERRRRWVSARVTEIILDDYRTGVFSTQPTDLLCAWTGGQGLPGGLNNGL